jgi:hypothetical protein
LGNSESHPKKRNRATAQPRNSAGNLFSPDESIRPPDFLKFTAVFFLDKSGIGLESNVVEATARP